MLPKGISRICYFWSAKLCVANVLIFQVTGAFNDFQLLPCWFYFIKWKLDLITQNWGEGETTALKIAVGTGCFRMERGSEGGKRHLECGRLTSPFKSLVKETWALKNWKKEALIRNHYLQSWLIIILGLWQSHRWELKGERAVAFGLGVANLRVSETG